MPTCIGLARGPEFDVDVVYHQGGLPNRLYPEADVLLRVTDYSGDQASGCTILLSTDKARDLATLLNAYADIADRFMRY